MESPLSKKMPNGYNQHNGWLAGLFKVCLLGKHSCMALLVN